MPLSKILKPVKGWYVVSKKTKKWFLIKQDEADEIFTTENGFSGEDKKEILSMKTGEEIDIFHYTVKYGYIKTHFSTQEK